MVRSNSDAHRPLTSTSSNIQNNALGDQPVSPSASCISHSAAPQSSRKSSKTSMRPPRLRSIHPPSKPGHRRRVDLLLPPHQSKAKRSATRATVWDILAGRVNYEGFIRPAFVNEHGEVRSRSQRPQTVEQVLARRRRMPIGWERWVEDISEVERTWKLENEADENERAPEGGAVGGICGDEAAKGVVMPDPGIMMALHTVAADYYWSEGQEEVMNMAFDESALMCAAILLEEQGKEMVGWNGYRVLEELDDPFDASEDAPALTNHEDGVNVDGAMVVG